MNIYVQPAGKDGEQPNVFYSYGRPQPPDRQSGTREPSKLMTIVVELNKIKQIIGKKLS